MLIERVVQISGRRRSWGPSGRSLRGQVRRRRKFQLDVLTGPQDDVEGALAAHQLLGNLQDGTSLPLPPLGMLMQAAGPWRRVPSLGRHRSSQGAVRLRMLLQVSPPSSSSSFLFLPPLPPSSLPPPSADLFPQQGEAPLLLLLHPRRRVGERTEGKHPTFLTPSHAVLR